MSPDVKYGKVENSTELVVAPFKQDTQEKSFSSKKLETNGTKPSKEREDPSQNSLYQRLFNKDTNPAQKPSRNSNVREIIDSRTLDNVSAKSSFESHDDEDSSESTMSSETVHVEENPFCSRSKRKLVSQIRSFNTLLSEISSQERKVFDFRVIPRTWSDSQMCDVYVAKPFQPDPHQIFAMTYDHVNENDERVSREYYVNVKYDDQISKNPKNTSANMELNDILMATLKISKFSRITLTSKNTVVNFLERIELIPTSKTNKQEISEGFKQMLINESTQSPLLINQGQIFKICGGSVLVTAKLFPETFKYCLCDAEILRERKIFVSDQIKDLDSILKAAGEISTPSNKSNGLPEHNAVINTNELVNMVEESLRGICIKNCLDGKNHMRKLGNFLITGNIAEGVIQINSVSKSTKANLY